jgi:hypothetical protein
LKVLLGRVAPEAAPPAPPAAPAPGAAGMARPPGDARPRGRPFTITTRGESCWRPGSSGGHRGGRGRGGQREGRL